MMSMISVVVVLFCVECCVFTIVFDGYVNGGHAKNFFRYEPVNQLMFSLADQFFIM